MITYSQWKLLNESLGGPINLGISHPNNIGVTGSRAEGITVDEMGLGAMMGGKPGMGGMDGPPMSFGKKKKKRSFPSPDMMGDLEGLGDDEDLEGDEEDIDGDEEDLEDDDLEDDEDMLGDEEDLEDDEEDIDGDEEGMGDEDMLGDEEGMEGEEGLEGDEEEMGFPGKFGKKKKKSFPPMGNPHDASAFMGYMRRMKRHMKKEACECPTDKKPMGKKDDEGKEGDKPAFLMKKKMKKKMKKEGYLNQPLGYELPKNTDFTSDTAFMKSMLGQYGNVNEKFFDGIHEDALIPPPASEQLPMPGEPGYSPATRIGPGSEPAIAESLGALSKRIKQLEKQLDLNQTTC